jgi:hypothetical protein
MKHLIRSLFPVVVIVACLLAALVMIWPRIPSLFTQGKLTLAFISYVKELELNGLIAVQEIRVEGNQPLITLLSPDSNEITQQDMQNVTEIALHTVIVFESMDILQADDIDIEFHRPAGQKIILVNRPEMPEALTFAGLVYGELTLSMYDGYFTSLINLAGYRRNERSKEYEDAYSVVQAICLAYAGKFVDDDPVCNIISVNAAAAWSGMNQKRAIDTINGYGRTNLEYLGSRNYQYRFIDIVYVAFQRN